MFTHTAMADTRTWDGSANNFWNDIDNWAENAVPADGDDLVFPGGAMNTLNINDLVGLDLNSITFSGDAYSIQGNSIGLAAAGITVTGTTSVTNVALDISIPATITIDTNPVVSISLNGIISGAGGITKTGVGAVFLNAANTYMGVTSINQGSVEVFNATGLGATAGGTTVANNAALGFFGGITVGAEPLTINGAGVPSGIPALFANQNGTSFAGDINVASNSTIGANGSFTLSGVLSGTGNLTKTFGEALILTADSSAFTNQMTVNFGTLLVNGQYGGPILVSDLSTGEVIVGGTGTVGPITVGAAGGIVAPGVSPGILTSGALSFTNASSIFRVELNGTTVGVQYDQLNVTGGVDLANATLEVTLGFVPAVGNTFTIINNDGVDAVVGTFNGLPNGAMFMASGNTLSIDYGGGDGNDVVLTVLGTSLTPSATPTDTPPTTATFTPSQDTPTATPTVTPSEVMTETPSGTPATSTPSPVPSSTATSVASDTPTATPTVTPTGVATATPTDTPPTTATFTASPTPSSTASDTPTIAPSSTAAPTITSTPSITPTAVPTGEGIGEECTSDSECMSLFCTDGVCCESRCQGPNQSCDEPGRAGICTTATPVPLMDGRVLLLTGLALLLVAGMRLRRLGRRSE